MIEELIQLAREMREADRRGEDLGLTEDESRRAMQDKYLAEIADRP